MKLHFAVVALSLLAISQQDNEAEIVDLFNFVELNLINLLQFGTYPALYDASHQRIKQCGCFYSPRKINWGSHIGLECKRQVELGQEFPEFEPEHCGVMCNDRHGFDTIVLCPAGWENSCETGCHPKELFSSVEERLEFWEGTVHRFLLDGTDYFTIKQEFLDTCGCESKARRILYGSKVGFDCVQREGFTKGPGCNAVTNCNDERGRLLVTFCPAGFSPSCAGCVKQLEGDDVVSKLRWMVGVTSDIVQLSLADLNWEPALDQILGCGCKGSVEQITYGAGIGVVCEIHSAELVGPNCGQNQICIDEEGKQILHICPTGFKPSCEQGCATPLTLQEQKPEL